MFDLIKVLGPRENFGEVVLVNPKLRSVTAVCLEDNTELLGMSNDLYNRIIEKAVKKDIN